MYLDRQAQQSPGVTFHRSNPSIVFTSNTFAATLKSPQPLTAPRVVRTLEDFPSHVTPKPPLSLGLPPAHLENPIQSEPPSAPRPHCSSTTQAPRRRPVNQSQPFFASAQDGLLTRPPRPPRVSAPASFHVICSLLSISANGSTSDIIASGTPPDSTSILHDSIVGGIPCSTSDVMVNVISPDSTIGNFPDSTSDITGSGSSPNSTDESSSEMSCSKLSSGVSERASWKHRRAAAERRGTPHPRGTLVPLQSED